MNYKSADESLRMHRLVCAFVVRKRLKPGFFASRPIFFTLVKLLVTLDLRAYLVPIYCYKFCALALENKKQQLFTDRSKEVLLLLIVYVISVLFLLCFRARLFIDALWAPAGKGLTSWLSFVMFNCEVVTFPLVSWDRCGA